MATGTLPRGPLHVGTVHSAHAIAPPYHMSRLFVPEEPCSSSKKTFIRLRHTAELHAQSGISNISRERRIHKLRTTHYVAHTDTPAHNYICTLFTWTSYRTHRQATIIHLELTEAVFNKLTTVRQKSRYCGVSDDSCIIYNTPTAYYRMLVNVYTEWFKKVRPRPFTIP